MMRAASHAGSWYLGSGPKLSSQLEEWLGAVEKKTDKPVRGLIAPHAGYSYSGPPAAFAYRYVDFSLVERVFILGPSHHVYLDGCALTKCQLYSTPLGNLQVDQKLNKELLSTGHFEEMSQKTDEDEHSIEMHLPYIFKVMEGKKDNFTILPILVGSISPEKEEFFGKLLSKYVADPKNLFVISSDFCHWGKRFSFTHYDKSLGQIYQSIEALDRRGMKIIEEINPSRFVGYLKETKNTICGRHPIAVFLFAIEHLNKGQGMNHRIEFTKYAQSSQAVSAGDSSVSYASAICYLE